MIILDKSGTLNVVLTELFASENCYFIKSFDNLNSHKWRIYVQSYNK